MKFENILKELAKDKYIVVKGEFAYQECYMVNGTALIDIVDGEVRGTNAKYKDVFKQIDNNRSHIQTIEGKKKYLTTNMKLGC